MEDKKVGKRPRLQLDFTPEAIERVEELRKTSGSKTSADVVRDALLMYEWFMQQRRDGWEIQLVKDDRVRAVELLLPGF